MYQFSSRILHRHCRYRNHEQHQHHCYHYHHHHNNNNNNMHPIETFTIAINTNTMRSQIWIGTTISTIYPIWVRRATNRPHQAHQPQPPHQQQPQHHWICSHTTTSACAIVPLHCRQQSLSHFAVVTPTKVCHHYLSGKNSLLICTKLFQNYKSSNIKITIHLWKQYPSYYRAM